MIEQQKREQKRSAAENVSGTNGTAELFEREVGAQRWDAGARVLRSASESVMATKRGTTNWSGW